jgi:hypothetical protein
LPKIPFLGITVNPNVPTGIWISWLNPFFEGYLKIKNQKNYYSRQQANSPVRSAARTCNSGYKTPSCYTLFG